MSFTFWKTGFTLKVYHNVLHLLICLSFLLCLCLSVFWLLNAMLKKLFVNQVPPIGNMGESWLDVWCGLFWWNRWDKVESRKVTKRTSLFLVLAFKKLKNLSKTDFLIQKRKSYWWKSWDRSWKRGSNKENFYIFLVLIFFP